MARVNDVVLLVNSLSKSEKRYFKIFSAVQEGEKFYLQLFDLIDKGSVGRQDLKERFEARASKASFDVTLKYLFKVLMKSMRAFDAEQNIDALLLRMMQDLRFLYQKGIYQEFLLQAEKLKSVALKYEKNFYFLETAQLELEYYTRVSFQNVSEAALVEKQVAINAVLEHEVKISHHSDLYQLLLHRFASKGVLRNENEKQKFDDLVLSESHLIANPHYHSFHSQQLHMLFQSVYFRLIGSPELSLDLYHELDVLFEKYSFLWTENPMYYVNVLEGILNNLHSTRNYDALPFFIEKLKTVKLKSPDQEKLWEVIYPFEIIFHTGRGEFEAAKEVLLQNREQVNRSAKDLLSAANAKVFYFNAVLYFGLKEWKNALHSLNQIWNNDHSFVSYEILTVTRVLALLVHYEMENFDYINYEIRGFERNLKKNGALYDLEKILFKFFRNAIKANDAASTQKCLMNGNKDILRLLENQHDNRLSVWFDIAAWFDAKIKRQPFAAYTRNKFNSRKA